MGCPPNRTGAREYNQDMYDVSPTLAELDATRRRVRADLAAAHRLAVMDDLHEGTWNHMSVVFPGERDHLLMTPADTHWSEVTAGGLVEVGPDDADRLRDAYDGLWVTYRIHYPVHAARPDATCMIHLHPPHATALGALAGGRLEFVDQAALRVL